MGKHYDFIEIGTSDFDTLIENADNNTIGLSIEPIKFYLDRLPDKENVTKVNVAISESSGFIDIYHIEEDKIIENKVSDYYTSFINITSLLVYIQVYVLISELTEKSFKNFELPKKPRRC